MQSRTSAAMASSATRRSASVTAAPPPRPPPARAPGTGGRLVPTRARPSAARRGSRRSRPRSWPRPCAGCPTRPRARGRGRRRSSSSRRTRPTKISSRPAAFDRQRVVVRARVVLDHDARDRREQRAGALRGDRVAGLDVDGLGVAHEDRDADRRARDAQVGQAQDLAVLGDDLPLLLGVAVGEEDVDLGQGVERDRVRVDLGTDRARRPRGRGSAPSSSARRRRRCRRPTGRCRRRPAPARRCRAAP